MPHAQVAAQIHVLTQGQHAACAQYPPVADDNGAVVHGRLDEEDVLQQLGGHGGIQHGAAAHHIVQPDIPLEHDQHAGLALGHLLAGHHRLVDGRLQLRLLLGVVEHLQQLDVAAAHLFQYLPYLRLEQHDNGQNAHLHQILHDIGDGVQLQYIRQSQHQQKGHHALEDILRAGALDHPQQAVHQKRDDGDIQHIRNADQQ